MAKMFKPDRSTSRVEYGPDGVLLSSVPMTAPFSDYDKMFLLYAHVGTFPHGKGWCPDKMSYLEWVGIILRRHPIEQHGQNCAFIANAFNVYQRHLVNMHSGLEVKMRPYIVDRIKHLSQEHIQEVLRIFGKFLGGDAFNKAMNALPDEANLLLQSLKIVEARVPGTPNSFKSLRCKALSAVTVFGQYTCMLNLCPFESASPHTFTLMGKPYTFDRAGLPIGRPNYIDCLSAVASNPVACAQFLHAYMCAFQHRMLGWPAGASKQVDVNCIFGVVTFAYMKYESSGRGGKHAHGQIVQPVLQTKRLEKLFSEGSAVEKCLYDFMEGFCCSVMPSPDSRVVSDTVGWDPRLRTDEVIQGDRSALQECLPLDGSKEELLTWANKVLGACNTHKHMPTCAKGSRQGDHSDCRMGYDRLIVKTSRRFKEDSLMVLLRRHDGMLVPYVLALVLACPSNHTMSLAVDASRFLREHQVWQDLVDAGEDAGEEPILPDAWLASAITSEYATKYSTKADNTPFNLQMLAMAHGISEGGNAQAAKKLLSQMLNKLTGSITYPLIMCASYLLGHDDRWFPVATAAHDLRAFHVNFLRMEKRSVGAGDIEEGEQDYTLTFEPNGNKTLTQASSKIKDYECRSDFLDGCSPIEIVMCYEVQGTTRASRALALKDPHPHAGKKGHNPKANIRIPLTFCNALVPPDVDATDEEKHEWAAWALGNFYPYDRMLNLLLGDTLIEKYAYWRANKVRGNVDAVAFQLLDNMILAAHARQAIGVRDKAERVRRSQMKAAGLEYKAKYELGDDFGNADEYGAEFDLHPDLNTDELHDDHIQSLLTHGQDNLCLGAQDQYTADAVGAISRQILPSYSEEDTNDSSDRAGLGTEEALRSANAAIKEARPNTLRDSASETLEQRHQLQLRTSSRTGKIFCKLVYMNSLPLAPTEAGRIAALNKALEDGGQPPYVRLQNDERPSMAATSDLFRLCEKQRFAFFMMAATFDAELRNETNIPQLKMALLGGAGTGKSEVNQALLWYAFQHQACSALAVMAYTWKAAQLLGNPYNPGYSTSTACGISCGRSNKTPGVSEKAMAIINPEVRIVLIDEISFVSQQHLGVSHCFLPSLIDSSDQDMACNRIHVLSSLTFLHAICTCLGD
jgi:Helitron helicase-like domain at N-terminus